MFQNNLNIQHIKTAYQLRGFQASSCTPSQQPVPVDITLVVWLETGRHSAALGCMSRGRAAGASEFRGMKLSAEGKAWQLIPTRNREVGRTAAASQSVLLYSCLKGPTQPWLLAYIHQESSEAPGGRVPVFVLQGNPFIHVNSLFPGVLLYQSGLSSSLTQT